MQAQELITLLQTAHPEAVVFVRDSVEDDGIITYGVESAENYEPEDTSSPFVITFGEVTMA